MSPWLFSLLMNNVWKIQAMVDNMLSEAENITVLKDKFTVCKAQPVICQLAKSQPNCQFLCFLDRFPDLIPHSL